MNPNLIYAWVILQYRHSRRPTRNNGEKIKLQILAERKEMHDVYWNVRMKFQRFSEFCPTFH